MTVYRSLMGLSKPDDVESAKEGGNDTKLFDFKRINIFIGPNNSGKSNVFKYFRSIKNGEIDQVKDAYQFDSENFGDTKDLILLEDERIASVNFHNGKLESLFIDNEDEFRNSLNFVDEDRSEINLSEILDSLSDNLSDYCSLMGEWLTDILEEKVKVDYIDGELIIIFTIVYSQFERRFSLDQLGRGVRQLIQILSYLYYKTIELKDKGIDAANFFIEEPETNLHHKAVISLINILNTSPLLNSHRYFFTTHSNAFIDQIGDNGTICSVVLETQERYTILTPCSSTSEVFNILDSLGIKASQVLQSNVVIWVEGPSDRIYIKHWLSLIAPNYIEGIHYSFLMYGGALLDHYSVFVDDIPIVGQEFIDILRTSRYAFLVADKDRTNENTNLKPRLNKITTFIDNLSKSERVYIDYYITKGREIENYVDKNKMLGALCNHRFKRKTVSYYVNSKKELINIGTPKISNLPTTSNFTYDDSFDIFFSRLYLSNELIIQHQLDPVINHSRYNEVTKKLSKSLNKVAVAEEIIKQYKTEDDIKSVCDLNCFLKDLKCFISRSQ